MKQLLWMTAAMLASAGVGYAVRGATEKPPPVVNFHQVVKKTPIDPERGGALTTVLTGEYATVNVWQLTKTIPAHYHNAHEEYVLVLEGEGEVRLGKETRRLRPGDLLRIPKKTVHRVTARGEKPFRGISIFAPAFDGKDRVFVDEK